MDTFDKAMSRLRSLRGKFEHLLEAAGQKSAGGPRPFAGTPAALREIPSFGPNPGNLRMFVHAPERLAAGAPLVVALHGCGQTAGVYDAGSGWSSLADRLGFVVLYPEQQPVNNPKNCFSWFLPGDIARDRGEPGSIRQMVEHAIGAYGLDRRRVFVTGLSAGGAMASVMLATYPDVFAGGAVIAGLPYGSARSAQQAFEVMFTESSTAPDALGDRVRAASKHRGPWPKLSVWHGTADPIVKPSNAEDIIRQWTDVHGLASAPTYEETIGDHWRRVWTGPDGNAVIEAFAISGMGHGVPLGTAGEESYGAAGAFFLDADISSTRRIADFWQLDRELAETQTAPAMANGNAPGRVRPNGAALAAAADSATRPAPVPAAANAERSGRRGYDPNPTIAAAFKAAGVPVPKFSSDFAPGPIIEAALKAAGLKRQ